MSKYEVTFEEYTLFCTATNRKVPGDEGWGKGKRPVIHVSWLDAIAYCNWLSEANGLTPAYATDVDGRVKLNVESKGYRLPTGSGMGVCGPLS